MRTVNRRLITAPRAVFIIALLALVSITATLLVMMHSANQRPPAGASTAQAAPAAAPLPKLDTQALPTTPPLARPAGCNNSLAGANGTWFPDWLENPQAQSNVPDAATRLRLVNFFWLGLGQQPSSIVPQPGDFGGPDLATELQTAEAANPCTWRFATVSDSSTPMATMARILTDPKARWANVMALANAMAAQPYDQGLTIDYEFALPNTQTDLNTYAAVAGWHNLTDRQEVGYLTNDYTELIREIAIAMHRQHRLLSVAVKVRLTNEVTYWDISYLSPFLYDYSAIASYADQLVYMATDFSYSSGNPGPIVPTTDLLRVAQVIDTYNIPTDKEAFELPVYGYNWEVNNAGKLLSGTQATTVTASQVAQSNWHVARTDDNETMYTYTDSSGHHHIVWYTGTQLNQEVSFLHSLCPGCALAAWADGNSDPAVSAVILNALGR
jgi:hypothetical protein